MARGRRHGDPARMAKKRESISVQRRWSILQRDSFTCAFCGAQPGNDRLNVDHIIPVARGGSDHDNNLVALCDRCNNGKGDRIAVPTRMCAEPCNAQGWTTWKKWGEWRIYWRADEAYLDYKSDGYPIALDRVHEPDWHEHVADKEWPRDMKFDFYAALAFARTLVRKRGTG